MAKRINRVLSIMLILSVFINCIFVNRIFADSSLFDPGFEIRMTEEDFFVSNPIYSLSTGEPLTALSPLQNVKITLTVKRTAIGTQNVTVITALYDSTGTMKAISYAKDTLNGIEQKDLVVNLKLPESVENTDYLKTYVWDDLKGIWSYNESFRFPFIQVIESNWNISGNWSMTSDEIHSGLSSLKVTGKNSGNMVWQDVTLSENTAYKLTFYAKGNSKFTYKVMDTNDNILGEDAIYNGSAEWKRYSYIFKTKENEDVKICFVDSDAGGISYIDDVAIVDDLVENGGFEEGDASWIYDSLCFDIQTDEKSEGNNALMITSAEANQSAYTEVCVPTYSKLMLSFSSKCSEAVICKVTDETGTVTISNTETSSSTGWDKNYLFVNTFDYNKIRIYFQTKTSSRNVSYIDDVQLNNLLYRDKLINSYFEDGLTGWTKLGSKASMEVVTEPVHSGNYAIRLYNRDTNFDGASQDIKSILEEQGKGDYYIEAWVRTNQPTNSTVALRFYVNDSQVDRAFTTSANNSGWTKISATIKNVTWDTLNNASIRIDGTAKIDDNTFIDVFADDISVFKLQY